MDRARIRVALGELIGRINIICDDMGYLAILEEVAEYNINKLTSRLNRGTIMGDGGNR